MAETDFTTELAEGGCAQAGDFKTLHDAVVTYGSQEGRHLVIAGPDGSTNQIVTVNGPNGESRTVLNTAELKKYLPPAAVRVHVSQVMGSIAAARR